MTKAVEHTYQVRFAYAQTGYRKKRVSSRNVEAVSAQAALDWWKANMPDYEVLEIWKRVGFQKPALCIVE